MTRMLWVSNGRMWPTGYGNQTNLFLPRLKKAGYDPVLFAFTDRMGAPITDADGILHVHPRFDTWGNDVYEAHMAWTKAQFSFGLFDFYATVPTEYAKHPHAHWTPVDGAPLRTDLADALRVGARWVVAMSRFGERVLKEAGFDPLYCPHGIDGSVFKPVDRAKARERMQKEIDADKRELRADRKGIDTRVELGDKFVVLMNAANNDARKGFFEGLSAFARFHRDHPNSLLYLHTDMAGVRGENLFEFIEMLDIPLKAIAYPNQYYYHMGMIDGEWLNDLYNTADVLLQPTYGEGFGIPVVEAQFAGCPVIATDCSTMPELIKTGVVLPGIKFARRAGVYWVRPLIEPLVQALAKSYETWQMGPLNRQSVSALVQEYEVDNVMQKYMLPVMERITGELKRTEPIIVPARGSGHLHRWANTGLYIGGKLHQPCTNGLCEAAWVEGRVAEGVFSSKIGDIKMKLEDDPDSGVAKIVMREAIDTYHLDALDLKPGDIVLDIGAHVGVMSIYLAKKYPGIEVVALEPHPANFHRLAKNIESNGVNTEVEAIFAAVTEDGRRISMPESLGDNSGGLSIYQLAGGTTSSMTLAALIAQYGRPTLIKMDCEGAEYEILEGNADLLKGVRAFVGEFHTNRVFTTARMQALEAAVRDVVPVVHLGYSPMSEVEVHVAA